jgi:hypothetical protein
MILRESIVLKLRDGRVFRPVAQRKPTSNGEMRMATGNAMVRAPEGFVRVGAVANVPYFLLEEGNVVQGHLLGIYVRDDKRSATGKTKFFQVELTASCKVREGRGEDVEVREAVAGEIINLNFNPKTMVLEEKCEEMLRGALYDVFAPLLGKVKLLNGNTMWNFDVSVKQVRPPKEQGPDFADDGAAAPAGE